jgi:hypothetical protein
LGRVRASHKKKEKINKFFKNYFKKICDFLQIVLLCFNQYRFVFLYCKDTNLVLKYLVFVKIFFKKNNKKIFCFHAYSQVSQKIKKKSYCIFI